MYIRALLRKKKYENETKGKKLIFYRENRELSNSLLCKNPLYRNFLPFLYLSNDTVNSRETEEALICV